MCKHRYAYMYVLLKVPSTESIVRNNSLISGTNGTENY